MKPIRITKREDKPTIGAKKLMHVLKNLDEGEWAVTVEEWKQTRTNLQNAFMHVCFDKYGDFVGEDPETAKFLLKKKFGCNHIIRDPETGSQHLFIKRTRNYTIEEGKVFIDRMLKHFEHNLGFIIDPEVRKQYQIDCETGELKEVG